MKHSSSSRSHRRTARAASMTVTTAFMTAVTTALVTAPATPAGAVTAPETRAAEQEALLGGGRARELMLRASREFVTVSEKRARFGEALKEIAKGAGATRAGDDGAWTADGRAAGATLVHCSGGRDRTGWMIAIVLTLLDVSPQDVLDDYLRSNTELAAWKASVIERLSAGGMRNPHLVDPLLDVDAAYLQASFEQAKATYSSFSGYVRTGLGIDGATLGKLRARLK